MPQVVQTPKSLSSVALLAVSQFRTMRSNSGGGPLEVAPTRPDHETAETSRRLDIVREIPYITLAEFRGRKWQRSSKKPARSPPRARQRYPRQCARRWASTMAEKSPTASKRDG